MAYAIQRIKDVPGEPRRTRKGAVLLCDTSSSMNSSDTWTGKRRIDHLAEVLAHVLGRTKVQALASFDSTVRTHPLTTSISLQEPQGGTDLTLALEWLRETVDTVPEQLLILSDGEPNNEDTALAAMSDLMRAWRMPPVHCYYCGPDSDRHAKDFLARLAKLGGPGSSMGSYNLAQPKRLAETMVLRITHQKGDA